MQHRLVAIAGTRAGRLGPAVWLGAAGWLALIAMFAAGDGTAIRHDRLLQNGPPLWLATILFIAGWQVMLLAMMVPASHRAFARVGHARLAVGFGAGYFAIWTVFVVLLFGSDAAVHWTAIHWPWLAAHPWVIAGATLVAVGAFQLSDLKRDSLDACRTLDHMEGGGGAREGFRHGLRCLGASGGLMLLAFALAASSLMAMAAITVLMLTETTAAGAAVSRPVGYVLIALGVAVLAGPITPPVL
jgi:predicted metal-binding membrane protein